MVEEDLYEVLGVTRNASSSEIETAYERLSDVYDPSSVAMYSLLGDDEISSQRSRLDAAYRVLADPDRRAAYDRSRSSSGSAPSYPDIVLPHTEGEPSSTIGLADSAPSPGATTRGRPVTEELPPPAPVMPEPMIMTTPVEPEPVRAPEPRPAPVAPSPTPSRPPARAQGIGPRRRLVPQIDVPDLTVDTEVGGGLFRRLRESAGASLEEVAQITKISKRYLRALEDNDFDDLPAAVYVRGFVVEYARILGLDPELAARSYLATYKRYKEQG